MTSTFDGLARLVQAYKEKLREDDYKILCYFIESVHTMQHRENSHRIDAIIEYKIGLFGGGLYGKRFQEWRAGRATLKEKKNNG